MEKDKVVLIMAQSGFLFNGSKAEGYKVYHPYKDARLFKRILRELVFRLFPFVSDMFYENEIFEGTWQTIVIWDPLITKKFIFKLHKRFPKAQINFVYWNMVGKATHLFPNLLPEYVRAWTYDSHDAKKYGLKLYTTYPYFQCYIRPHLDNIYDVLFVGKDKGRGEFLLQLEREMIAKGLKTKFIITKTDRLSRDKSFYQSEISYEELSVLISHSKSVLNVVMQNQEGLTLRDLEYVYQGVKLITTNKAIVSDPIYDENNVFVIKDGNIDGIETFLNRPMNELPNGVMEHHKFDSFINELVS